MRKENRRESTDFLGKRTRQEGRRQVRRSYTTPMLTGFGTVRDLTRGEVGTDEDPGTGGISYTS